MEATKKVTTPSGLEVEIAKPGTLTLHRVRGALPILTEIRENKASPKAVGEAFEMYYGLICRCSVTPKFVSAMPDEVTEDETSLDVLSDEDVGYLAGQILAFAGLTTEAEEAVRPLSGTGAV